MNEISEKMKKKDERTIHYFPCILIFINPLISRMLLQLLFPRYQQKERHVVIRRRLVFSLRPQYLF